MEWVGLRGQTKLTQKRRAMSQVLMAKRVTAKKGMGEAKIAEGITKVKLRL